MNTFKKLGLSGDTLKVLEAMGFKTPTPVQQQSIPILLSHNPTDFIGLAQTGTGKTAAFGLPLIDLVNAEEKAIQALVVAPTRELVQQIEKQLTEFASGTRRMNIVSVFGGAAITGQIKELRRPVQILVATPGRLLDLINRKAVSLDKVNYVVLDEADEMLSMGFKEDIDSILSFTPEHRVTWLFSATMPAEIRQIVKKYMKEPHEVSANADERSNKDISHKYVITKTSNKIPALRRFLDIQPEMRGILFCRTRRETQQIADDLSEMGYATEALHGELTQAQRDSVMKRFKSRSMQLLIATDVAARGIDVNDLTHVIHHTLPDQLEAYTHRSGRTGRAGKKGISLALINGREGYKIRSLEKSLQIKFERIEVPHIEEMKFSRIAHWANIIVNTKVDDQAENILNQLKDHFRDLSKEEILKRLITSQLDHLVVQEGESSDLNEDIGQKKTPDTPGGYDSYFINIGTIDGVTKGDLLHFLSDISGIRRKDFGEITLQKNCAYFQVEHNSAKDIESKFEGIYVEDRPIRVNADHKGPKKKEGKKQNKGKSAKYGKPRKTGRRIARAKR